MLTPNLDRFPTTPTSPLGNQIFCRMAVTTATDMKELIASQGDGDDGEYDGGDEDADGDGGVDEGDDYDGDGDGDTLGEEVTTAMMRMVATMIVTVAVRTPHNELMELPAPIPRPGS